MFPHRYVVYVVYVVNVSLRLHVERDGRMSPETAEVTQSWVEVCDGNVQ